MPDSAPNASGRTGSTSPTRRRRPLNSPLAQANRAQDARTLRPAHSVRGAVSTHWRVNCTKVGRVVPVILACHILEALGSCVCSPRPGPRVTPSHRTLCVA